MCSRRISTYTHTHTHTHTYIHTYDTYIYICIHTHTFTTELPNGSAATMELVLYARTEHFCTWSMRGLGFRVLVLLGLRTSLVGAN
jgi:hypothetical protein